MINRRRESGPPPSKTTPAARFHHIVIGMAQVTAKSPIDDVRIEQLGGGAVTMPAKLILEFRERIHELETALRELKTYAEGHHSQEGTHVWLHSLTVDIPHQIDLVLDR